MELPLNKIIQGDCLDVLKTFPENSVDSIVTDPPYELGFMGKSWDSTGIANNKEMWGECLRVLKPGGHLLAFSGTRTYHRMASAIEDAGFEVRDMIEWVYGSGFPKSLNVGKVLDKYLKTGNASWNGTGDSSNGALGYSKLQHKQDYRPEDYSNRHQNKDEITEDRAKQWEGWGTALKPSHEPVIVSMKPLQVEQIFAILIDNIWNNLPVSDVMQNLRDTQAKLNEVVSTVPVNVRTNFLENIDSVEFAETLTTSLATKSKKEKGNSVQENVALSGEKLLQEIKTHIGEGEGVSLVDISTSVQMGDISENIVLLWKNISEELLNQTNMLTTRTAIKQIIELKTLRSCLIQNIGINTGRSTNIPPNHEPICVARKPLAEKSVAENVLKYGTGGINIDESRVEYQGDADWNNTFRPSTNIDKNCWIKDKNAVARVDIINRNGRFPANLIHDNSEEVRECFPDSKSTGGTGEKSKGKMGTLNWEGKATGGFGDSGNASRFFKSIIYQAKASKSERNKGCEELYILKDNTPIEDIEEIKHLLSI